MDEKTKKEEMLNEEHEHCHDEGCDCGCEDEEALVKLTDEAGNVYNFYHIATLDYEGKDYAFFQPAEEVAGVDPDEVVIFEISAENELLPVEDQATLDAVFNEFTKVMEEDECDCGDEHHHHHCDCGCEDEYEFASYEKDKEEN